MASDAELGALGALQEHDFVHESGGTWQLTPRGMQSLTCSAGFEAPTDVVLFAPIWTLSAGVVLSWFSAGSAQTHRLPVAEVAAESAGRIQS